MRLMLGRWLAGLPLGAVALTVLLSACGASSPAATPSTSGGTAGAAATDRLTVSPLPGTGDASPATQISFLGPAGTHVVSLTATGSRSGAHPGRLRAYSTGTGESFLPSRPFLAGERVTVRAQVEAGGPAQAVETTFTVAHQASVSRSEFPLNPGDPRAVQHYGSLTVPALRITTPPRPGAAPGDLFLAPYQGQGRPGPMIVDQQGHLVWFHPLPVHDIATNFQVQSYQGQPVLTWWQGRVLQVGFGQGEDVIYDSSYHPLATVSAGNGYHADLHEIRLTPQGTAWIDIFDPIHANLSSVHGSSDGVLTDSIIQQIDIKTGLVMWEWHALGHIALSESYNPVSHNSYPWDYIHINSIDPGSNEDVLLSARSSWALYDVDLRSGAINWRLGGKRSNFHQSAGARFYWQHDAEFQPGGLISVFDNGSTPPKERSSRGLLLAPDPATHTVALRQTFVNPAKRLLASSQGNLLSLSGGDWLMGYGGLPNITEYDASGHVLFDASFGKDVQNFRAYLAPWPPRQA
jgi:Arylsulfotransferase (ASST)